MKILERTPHLQNIHLSIWLLTVISRFFFFLNSSWDQLYLHHIQAVWEFFSFFTTVKSDLCRQFRSDFQTTKSLEELSLPASLGSEGRDGLRPLGCTVAQENKVSVCSAAEEQRHAVRNLVNITVFTNYGKRRSRQEDWYLKTFFFFLKARATVLGFVWSFPEGTKKEKKLHFNF